MLLQSYEPCLPIAIFVRQFDELLCVLQLQQQTIRRQDGQIPDRECIGTSE